MVSSLHERSSYMDQVIIVVSAEVLLKYSFFKCPLYNFVFQNITNRFMLFGICSNFFLTYLDQKQILKTLAPQDTLVCLKILLIFSINIFLYFFQVCLIRKEVVGMNNKTIYFIFFLLLKKRYLPDKPFM